MKPNIVIVISDALRPKDLSLYYDSVDERDTNLKKIASKSLIFLRNFSASNASDPSVTSIFSGLYPKTSGFIHQHPFTKGGEIEKLGKIKFWLPKYLKSKGYATFSATPLHLWFKKGFDQYLEKDDLKGSKGIMNNPIIKRMLLSLPNWAYRMGKKTVKLRASTYFYPAEEVINKALSYLNESKKPFFLFMHLVDTHYPYFGANNNVLPGKKTLQEILKSIDSSIQKEYIKKRFVDISAKSLEEIEEKRNLSIKYFDWQINRLYMYLKEKKLWDNTIFIIMSDHGDNFGEHNIYFCRGGLYNTSIHVPLIIHLPKTKPKKIDEITQSIDIPATIVELIEKNETYGLDGRSLLPLIKCNRSIRKKAVAYDGFCDDRLMFLTKTKKTIITEGEKKCYLCGATHNTKKEVYDLENDFDEIKNLSKSQDKK